MARRAKSFRSPRVAVLALVGLLDEIERDPRRLSREAVAHVPAANHAAQEKLRLEIRTLREAAMAKARARHGPKPVG